MLIQLSSGQGPAECELAVKKLSEALIKEYENTIIVSSHPGKEKNCLTSVILSTPADLSFLEGSVQWICESPFRNNHKRKNWFVDVSIIPEKEEICMDKNYRFERFQSKSKNAFRTFLFQQELYERLFYQLFTEGLHQANKTEMYIAT